MPENALFEAAEAGVALRAGPLMRVPSTWQPVVPGAPFIDDGEKLSATPTESPVLFDWASETARRVGTLVHAQLQRLDLATAAAQQVRASGLQFERWLALHGVPEERLAQASTRVITALCNVLEDPRGRWILDNAHRDAVREHALSGRWNGALTRVVFDRSFIDQGIRWVIDYKTSEHTGGGREEFLDREVERYRSQLQRYADFAQHLGSEAVRIGLYFPLMGAWREWAA